MSKSTLEFPAPENNYQQEHVLIMLENLKRSTGQDLIKKYGFLLDTLGEQIFHANFYILSHNHAADPILTYGNDRVLKQWEVSWAELTTMYSRDTAKPVDRSARLAIMEQVNLNNYISNYSGVRVSKTGKEFKILDATVWNLFDNDGSSYGQAAWFELVENCDD
jgi:MEKHLA domain